MCLDSGLRRSDESESGLRPSPERREWVWTPAFAGATSVGVDSGLRRSDECGFGLRPCRSDESGSGLRPTPERRMWVWIPACAGTTTDFAKGRWGVMSWRDVRSDALHFASG